MKNRVSPGCKQLLLLIFWLLPSLSYSQNVVLNVTGKVLANGQTVKKGDNLKNDLKVVFDDPNAELKVLSPIGVCVIKYKNYKPESNPELLELIKFCIRKNSVATLDTRAWKINPTQEEQVKLVDALCKTLNPTPDNVNEIFGRYIAPYCMLEFETPYWQDIAHFLQTNYGFDPPLFTGELMTAEQYQSIPMVPKVRSLKPIPLAASLKKYCPIPGSQGQYGTCTGWASAYAARTISWAVKNNLTDVQDITNQAFSPSFVYTQIKDSGDINCINGSNVYKSVEVLKTKGAIFQTDLPFSCNPDLNPFFQQAQTYAIKDFQRLTEYTSNPISEEDFDNIKKALAENKPVIGSITCYQSFMRSHGSKIWNGELDSRQGHHAICIIGYDDNFDNGDGTFGAVELMNSWSPLWGNGGFIQIKYRDFPKILNYAVSLYDDALPLPPPEPPKPLPEPPPAPEPLNRMEGSFDLILSDGTSMPLESDDAAIRNFRLVSAELENTEETTYNISTAYPAGTLFRIRFTSAQPAYIYVLSTDSQHSPLAQLFPDPQRNISALLDFNSEVSVSIPDETQYIQMDERPGEDYLCVIYSKEALIIHAIKMSFQQNPGKSFVKTVKEALQGRIVEENEVVFEKNRIAFKAASEKYTAVPVFIKIKHR